MIKFKLFHILLVFWLPCIIVEAGRILAVIPTPSISHQVVFRPLLQELAKRGHDVTVITTDPAFPKGQTPANLTEIDVHDISYKLFRESGYKALATGKSEDTFEQVKVSVSALSRIFEMQMMTDEVQAVIKSNKRFDLLMFESIVRPAISLSHILKVPVIVVSSLSVIPSQFDIFGAPTRPPLMYPSTLRQRLFDLSLLEKLHELYNHYNFESLFSSMQEEDDKIVKRLFGPDILSTRELLKNVDMMFLNVHPIWEFNRPVPPNVIFMGGLHQNPSKELPQDLKTYLDSSKNGVIYVSFGTNVSPALLSPEKIQIMVKVLSKLPYDVLWKWDLEELPNQSKNIKISKWLPQCDLLKHSKIKLFITQGGLQSTDEAISAGVPLIGMPMLGDQWYNVEHYVYHKIGIRLDIGTLTEEKFENGVNTIVKDDSYRKNIVKLRSVMNDQPQKPLERAVWWTEHVLRHGGASHLKALTANMSWNEYLDLELFVFLGLSSLTVLVVVGFVVYYLFNFVRHSLLGSSKLKKN